jgi:hypothetical protein
MKSLKDYIKVYKNAISEEICKKTLEDLKNAKFNSHTFYNSFTNTYYQNENEPLNSFDVLSTDKILGQTIWEKLNDYYFKDINHSWFGGWNGFSNLKYIKYNENYEMSLHWDCIYTLFDGERKGIPTLTVLGLLNDDFEGGDFIMFENMKIKLEKGDLLIFPSTFLYPHKVNKITKGSRYTFISWVW